MKRSLSFLVISSVWALAACSNGGSEQAYQELKDSVQSNEQARSITEWHMADANPEKIFARWNEALIAKQITTQDVCYALGRVEDDELQLFEEEIRKPDNKVLISDCKDQLISRLEDHWSSERRTLAANVDNYTAEVANSGFRFADSVQYRDVSAGYYAVAGDVGPKQVILTFDDGPSEAYTASILATLKKANVKAIFFQMGKNVNAHPELSRMVAKDGHSLGGHSMTHSCLGNRMLCKKNNNGHLFTLSEAISEVMGSLNAIKKAVGWVDPFFRFPYGESSPALKAYLREQGVGEFYWSIDSEDWKKKPSQQVVTDVMAQLNARGKGMILFHDIQRKTMEALPEILRQLYKKGYQPVLLRPKSGVIMSKKASADAKSLVMN